MWKNRKEVNKMKIIRKDQEEIDALQKKITLCKGRTEAYPKLLRLAWLLESSKPIVIIFDDGSEYHVRK